ncbi:hypothetical protein FRC11_010466 [Ceratobasidium sp. 423]|nr:hypothetical protein FRC11_010466 [Ceratobasidium sp. 423]
MVFAMDHSTTPVAMDTAMDTWVKSIMPHTSNGFYQPISLAAQNSTLNMNLGTMSWAFDELDELETVAVDALSGAFALFKVLMSQADYWVSVSLDTLSPACDDPNNDEW